MRRHSLVHALLIGSIAGTAAAQQVNFTNSTPPTSVRLQSGSTVAVDNAGNINVSCDPAAPDGCARLQQGTGGGNGASFTAPLSVQGRPAGPQNIDAGTQITLVAQVANAEVCLPRALNGANPVTPSISGWNAPFLPSGTSISQTITLPTSPVGATLTFQLDCMRLEGGARSEQQITLQQPTTPPPPPPPDCPSGYPTSTAYTNASPGATAYQPLSGLTGFRNVNGFAQLLNQWGFPLNEFPQTGTSGILEDAPRVVRVIRFVVPDPFIPPANQRFVFMGQPNSFDGARNAYISVSTCPGDFRIPAAQQPAPAGDPTFAEGCRNWREPGWTFENGLNDIFYAIGNANDVSSPSTCTLVPGRTYYVNILMVRPQMNRRLPPITGDESTLCVNSFGTPFTCGHFLNAGG